MEATEPHIPVLSPTAKQLESLLNDIERTCVVFGDSIFGRVFIASVTIYLESVGDGAEREWWLFCPRCVALVTRLVKYGSWVGGDGSYPGSTVKGMADVVQPLLSCE